MKSVASMIMVFIGIAVIVYNDWFSFFAQDSFLHFSIILTIVMLVLSVVVIGYLTVKKKGGHHEKDKHLI